MEIIPVTLTIRGHRLDLEVPGEDAPPAERMIAQVEMLILCAIAREDAKVDEVLRAFGVTLQQVDVDDDGNETTRVIFR